MDISVIHGWLPIAVQGLAVAALMLAVVARSASWLRRWVAVALVCGVTVTGVVFWFIRWQDLAEDRAPVAFWVWNVLSVVAVTVLVGGWLHSRWWQRGAAIAAVPLSLLCVALMLDRWTGYLPTIGSAWGRAAGTPLTAQITLAQAEGMRRTHQVPARGALVAVDTPDQVSGFAHRTELVYLPPVWFAPDAPALPAILMIGGEFGHPTDWPTSGNARVTADRFAAGHNGAAPVLVFADSGGTFGNDTECVDGVRGNAATHLTAELRPYVQSTFGTGAQPTQWAVAGWSTGGTCAFLLAVKYPELFGSFLDIDGQRGPDAGSHEQTVARLFGGDQQAFDAFDPPRLLDLHGWYTDTAGWFGVTGNDRPPVYRPPSDTPAPGGAPSEGAPAAAGPEDHDAIADDQCASAAAHGIACAVVGVRGGHDFASAGDAFAAALPWLAGRLGSPGAVAIGLPRPAA